jgi:Meiotically Up-regulated Gene 113 (MUG113) protein
VVDAGQNELFNNGHQVGAEDNITGHIYVLRSLSQKPEIREMKNLYKIGFSAQPVKERIVNAAKEPTYLMADVKLVIEYDTYNMDPQKFESLLHRFFAKACVNFDIYDENGQRHSPREWFVVPIPVIETAVKLLINGEIVNYLYNASTSEIVSAE